MTEIDATTRRPAGRPRSRALLAVAAAAAVSLLVGACSAPAGSGRSDDAADIGKRVVTAGVPGFVARLDDGSSVTEVAEGVADRDAQTPASTDREFYIGSITKSFVATVVLQVVGEGRLRLEDTVEDWLPGVVPGGDRISLRMLLQHTSGLADYVTTEAMQQDLTADPQREFTEEQLLAYSLAVPVSFAPGDGWEYSNTGYVLAGMILEEATATPARELVAKRIVEPLGLTRTYWEPDARFRDGRHLSGYSIGMEGDDLTFTDVTDISMQVAGASGAITSTVGDLMTFRSALFGGDLLSPALLEEMLTVVPSGADAAGSGFEYGLGIGKMTTACGELWGHNGGSYGYSTEMWSTRDGERGFASASTFGFGDVGSDELMATYLEAVDDLGCQVLGTPSERAPQDRAD